MKPEAKWTMIVGGTMMLGGGGGGMLLTVGTMLWVFRELGRGGADPRVLALWMGDFLLLSAWGILVGVIGFVVLAAGLIIWLATRESASSSLPE